MQSTQGRLYFFTVNAARHKAAHAAAAEHAQTLGIVLCRNAVGIVVAAEHIAADTGFLQILTEQAGDFTFAHAASAAYADNGTLMRMIFHNSFQLLHQNGKYRGRFLLVAVTDFNFITGHITMHHGRIVYLRGSPIRK